MVQTLSFDTQYTGTYIAILCRLMTEQGLDIVPLLSAHKLQREQLLDPQYTISLATAHEIMSQCIELNPDPALAFKFGQRIHLASHGDLGVAALACETLGAAIDVMVEHSQSRMPSLRIEKILEGDKVIMRSHELLVTGPLKQFTTECYLASFLVGKHFSGLVDATELWRVCVDYPSPANAALYPQYLCPNITFSAPYNDVIFDRSLLSHPLPMPSASTRRQALDRLSQLTQPVSDSPLEQVQNIIDRDMAKGVSLDSCARQLHLSTRTLIRRLADQGQTFKTMLEQTRYRQACQLLQRTNMSTENIAVRLGYSEPANFTRAFKRWADCTPSAYRRDSSATQMLAT